MSWITLSKRLKITFNEDWENAVAFLGLSPFFKMTTKMHFSHLTDKEDRKTFKRLSKLKRFHKLKNPREIQKLKELKAQGKIEEHTKLKELKKLKKRLVKKLKASGCDSDLSIKGASLRNLRTQIRPDLETRKLDQLQSVLPQLTLRRINSLHQLLQQIENLERDILSAHTPALISIVKIVKNFQFSGVNLSDLIGYAMQGYYKGLDLYDPDNGQYSLFTCTKETELGAILRALPHEKYQLTQNKQSRLKDIQSAEEFLMKELERQPYDEEIIAYLKHKSENLKRRTFAAEQKILRIKGHQSLQDVCCGLDGSELSDLFEEHATEHIIDDENYHHPIEHSELKDALDMALLMLDDHSREIIDLRYDMLGDDIPTLKAIGETYEVTGERIRQIESKAIEALQYSSHSKTLESRLD